MSTWTGTAIEGLGPEPPAPDASRSIVAVEKRHTTKDTAKAEAAANYDRIGSAHPPGHAGVHRPPQ